MYKREGSSMVLHCSLINLIQSLESRDYPYIMIIVFFQVIDDSDHSSFRIVALEDAKALLMQICVCVAVFVFFFYLIL